MYSPEIVPRVLWSKRPCWCLTELLLKLCSYLYPELNQLCGAEARSTGPTGAANTNDDDGETALRTEAERSAMKATILKVAINLTNEGLLGARDARVVNDMIQRHNPVLVAAFKVRRQKKPLLMFPETIAGVCELLYAYLSEMSLLAWLVKAINPQAT